MTEHLQFSAWENFYVIVGSSGAALIGVQFVVIALLSDMRQRTSADSISAFGTSTVVHFGGALLVSALMSVPWPSLFPASVALAICGLGGLVYGAAVVHRARRQTVYAPVMEDWLWYAILPCGLYAALGSAALFLRRATAMAALVIAAAALGLLLVGIHNAWDAGTHMIINASRGDAPEEPGRPDRGPAPGGR